MAAALLCGLAAGFATVGARADNTLNCTLQTQDGAPAAKLDVVLTNTATKKEWKKKTNDKGMVEFKGLPDGTYQLDGAMQGSLLTKASGIELSGNTSKTCSPVFVSINILNQLLTDANNEARAGKADSAIDKARQAVDLAPGIANTHMVLAIAYSKKGMVDEALASAKKAAEIDPNQFGKMEQPIHMEALGTQASALLAKQDFDGAIKKYMEIAAIAPNEGTVYYNIALAYGHKNDYDNAIKSIDKAIALNPDDAEFKQRKLQLQDLYLKSTEKSLDLAK
jgi:tetratricopeptide (TPR) repeat protein